MTNNSTIPADAILNPYTPLAFLPSDVADQYQVMCYVYVATLAVSSMQYQTTTCDLTSRHIYRRTHGIGLCQFQTNIELSVKDLTHPMSRISYQGQ